jgi:hypothetical protein
LIELVICIPPVCKFVKFHAERHIEALPAFAIQELRMREERILFAGRTVGHGAQHVKPSPRCDSKRASRAESARNEGGAAQAGRHRGCGLRCSRSVRAARRAAL